MLFIKTLISVITGWQLLRRYPGDRWLVVRLVAYSIPILHALCVPALIVTLIKKQYRWAGGLSLLITLFMQEFWPLLTRLKSPTHKKHTLRVMTFNVHHSNDSADGLAQLFTDEQLDIACFQEIEPRLAEDLYDKLQAEYPYRIIYEAADFRQDIMSRFPLAEIPRNKPVKRAHQVVIDTPYGEIVLWHVHPNPVTFRSWERQRELLAYVADELAQEDRPLMLMGDFNATPQHTNYGLIAKHLTDVQIVVGRGMGFTYPDFSRDFVHDKSFPKLWQSLMRELPPLLDLDHIFVSHHFSAQETHIISDNYGSDHRPVVATLQLD